MGQPTRSTVNGWNLTTLRTQADGLVEAAVTLRTQTQAVVDAAQGTGNWHGESQRACEERALSDQTEINKLGTDIDRAGNILNNTANAIEPNRTTALTRCDGLERDDFAVADDWTVTETRDYATAIAREEEGSEGYNKLVAARDLRANDALNATLSLQALADQMGVDDQAGADALANAFGNAEINAPAAAGLSRQQAARDTEAIADGTATPQQKARFNAATSLTPEQKDALIQGRDAVIGKGQFEYLQGVYAKLGEGGLDAFTSFGGDDPALKASLANGLQILSNPHVRTDQPIDNVFSKTINPIIGLPTTPGYLRGGLSQLPSAIRDPLTQQAARSSLVTFNAGTSTYSVVTKDFPTLTKLGDVANILSHGDVGIQLGSDIDRALIVRSSEIAGAAADQSAIYGTGNDYTSRADISEVLGKMTSVAGNDHIAVHDALMTGRDGGPSATSAMPQTIDIDGTTRDYNASQAMTKLLSFDWPDGTGASESGPNNMFRWIGDSAAAPDGSPPNAVAESWRAGESGSELARIIAENKEALMDVHGGAPALGEVNPEVTRTLALAISPHLGDLAGAPDGLFTTNGTTELDSSQQLTDIFSVLDTDAEAGRSINTAASQTINYLNYQFGQDPTNNNFGELTGRIEGAMYTGLDAQTADDLADKRYAATLDYAEKGGIFDSGKAIVGSIPMAAPIKVAFDTLAPWAKLEAIGDPTDPSNIQADDSSKALKQQLDSTTTTTARYEQILNSYASSHAEIRDDPTLGKYFDDKGLVNLQNFRDENFKREVVAVMGPSLIAFETTRTTGREPKDW
ncbi:hypothetical protein [Williamsia sp.]|uniref:TPR repeat region-containing protein n=1 Tax=Williamsia sp. TaxID=1872085 RepID=UPI002F92F9E3